MYLSAEGVSSGTTASLVRGPRAVTSYEGSIDPALLVLEPGGVACDVLESRVLG
jgi:hypothetical protein